MRFGWRKRLAKMQTGTVISYSDDTDCPRAEVVLRNGDHIQLVLGRDGRAIRRLASSVQPSEALFQASPDLASRVCAGLFSLETTPRPTPLRILVAAVVQLGSAEEVENAFREAAAQVL